MIIKSGEISESFKVRSINDTIIETNESVQFDILNVANAYEDGIQKKEITILDDDYIPYVQLLTSKSELSEDEDSVMVTIELDRKVGKDVEITLEYSGSSNQSDYSVEGNKLTKVIYKGDISTSFYIVSIQDDEKEIDEDIKISISSVNNGKEYLDQKISIKIIDDESHRILDIVLDKNSIIENNSLDDIIGNLKAIDTDSVNTSITFSLKDTYDYEAFKIEGNKLLADMNFDYEDKSLYQIEVLATSFGTSSGSGGYIFSKILNINILDKSEIFEIYLSNNKVDENSGSNTLIGSLSTDNDGANLEGVTYSLTSNYDNSLFTISDDQLFINENQNFEDVNSYVIEVNAFNSNYNSLTDTLHILINDTDEIFDIILNNNSIEKIKKLEQL